MVTPPLSAGCCGRQLANKARATNNEVSRAALLSVCFIQINQAFSSPLNQAATSRINGRLLVYTIPLPLLETGSQKLMKKLTTICIALALSGCYSRAPTNQQDGHQELVVAAAANLTDAFAEIGSRFTSKTGIRVVFSFGATAKERASGKSGVRVNS